MDCAYLKRVMGSNLVDCLTEVAMKRPIDPIEYIAFWLRKRVDTKAKIEEEGKIKFDLEMRREEYRGQVERECLQRAEMEKMAREQAARQKREEEEKLAQEKEAEELAETLRNMEQSETSHHTGMFESATSLMDPLKEEGEEGEDRLSVGDDDKGDEFKGGEDDDKFETEAVLEET